MLRILLFVGVMSVCIGCGPEPPRQTEPPRYVPIALGALVNAYLHSPNDRTWGGAAIQVRLSPQAYRIANGAVEAHFANAGRPGFVRFICPAPPPDNSAALIISGVCRGTVRDGITREAGVDYYVRVDDCSVTAYPPRPTIDPP